MLNSVASSNRRRRIRCHVVYDGVRDEIRTRIAECCSPLEIAWYRADGHPFLELEPVPPYTRAPVYLKLTIVDLLPPDMERASTLTLT